MRSIFPFEGFLDGQSHTCPAVIAVSSAVYAVYLFHFLPNPLPTGFL